MAPVLNTLDPISAHYGAYEQCNQEFRKQERYCQKQREVLRALEDLAATERTMYELDHRKDQVMTACKVALANLAMWVRDRYFPATYAHATWQRLLPFFRLAGRVIRAAESVRVGLRPFNDRQLNRDLVVVCEQVNKASPQLPDGRHLILSVGGMTLLAPDMLRSKGTIKNKDEGHPMLEPFPFPSPRLL